jgi:hypothetical protein
MIFHILKSLLYIFVYFCAASTSSSTLQIMGITFGCLILCVAIFGICTNLRKRKTTSNQTATSSRLNQSVQLQSFAMNSAYRNVATVNAIYAPYTISMPTKPVVLEEELPPPYEAAMSSLTTQQQERPDRF